MNFCRIFAALSLVVLATPSFADGIPTWPIAGSDADFQDYSAPIGADAAPAAAPSVENIRIISKIGGDLTVDNEIRMGGGDYYGDDDNSFSGGASMTHPYFAPSGFSRYEGQGVMPFMHSEMPYGDGADVLSVSKTNRKGPLSQRPGADVDFRSSGVLGQYSVEEEERPTELMRDQVRSWVVMSGQNLREVLQSWCDKEGWDLIWNTPREYPIAASAVFKGQFLDVSSALVRNFSRAMPIPYAKFYKGNRVLVVSTTEDN